MNDETVLERVAAAFAGVPRPAEEALINRHCCECLETSEALGGSAWQEVSLEQLLAARETALLTVEAWRYYLPAVIAWSVREPDAVDVIADNLVMQLTPPGEDGGLADWFEPRTRGFTSDQRAAIAAFLVWFAEHGGAPAGVVDGALAYWSAG